MIQQNVQSKPDDFNAIYQISNLSLSIFDRAVQVARAFQYFRIKKVTARFKPWADTYQQSTNPGSPVGSLPYLYHLMDKGDTLFPNSFNGMRDAGAKPVRFDDRTIVLSWKPNVLMFTKTDASGTGITPSYNMSKTSPWLSTNDYAGTDPITWTPSTLQHTGIIYGVESAISFDVPYNYDVEYEVTIEFKKPLSFTTSTDTVPVHQKSL